MIERAPDLDAYIPLVFFAHKRSNKPVAQTLTWPQLCELLTTHDVRSEKDGKLFSCTVYAPDTTRGNANVLAMTAAVVDLDHDITIDEVRNIVAPYNAITFSTFSHTNEAPRLRVVMPLMAPVEGADWAQMWPRLNLLFNEKIDRATKDPARIHYLPSCHDGNKDDSFAEVNTGDWLDINSLPEPQSKPKDNVIYLNGNAAAVEHDRARKYALTALQREADKVATAADGHKHERLLKSTTAVAGFIPDGYLTSEEVEQQMFAAVESRAEDKATALQTIRDGIKYGIARPRRVPEEAPKIILHGAQVRAYISGASEDEAADETDECDGDTEAGPYAMQNRRTVFRFSKTDKSKQTVETESIVCDFVAMITEEITTEDGSRSFKIEGKTYNGRKFMFEATAEQVADERQFKALLIKAAGAKAGIRAGMNKHLFPAIDLFTKNQVQVQQFNRTGWADDVFLIPGREPQDTVIALPRKLPYEIDRTASLETGLQALEKLMEAQRPEMATVALAVLFQAPLAAWANWRGERYGIFISGRTGSLKSSWAQTAMAIYGPRFMGEENLIKLGEGATRNAIMNYATHVHDLPMLIDNYKPSTGDGPKGFVTLMHAFLEGGEKDRLTRAATMRESKAIFAWPVVTGEDIPESDAAALARILVVPFAWQRGEPNPALSFAQEHAAHLCAVGGAWLEWIESDEGRNVAKQAGQFFIEARAVWADALRSKRTDMANALRVASNLASNELTWWAMRQCPALSDIANQFDQAHMAGLTEVSGAMASHTAESQEAVRYLSALRQLMATERCVLVPRGRPMPEMPGRVIIGWHGEAEDAYILPEIAMREVLALLSSAGGLGGISNMTLYRQLDSLGYVASKGNDAFTKVLKEMSRTHRVLHLTAKALQAEGEEDGPVTDLVTA